MPTIVRGQKGTGNLSTYRIKYSIADGIALLDPNENPLTYVSQKIKRNAIGARKRSWLTDQYRPEFATVNGTATTGTTTITVDTATYFAVGDIWRNYLTAECVHVTAVDTSGNTLGVTRGFSSASGSDVGAADTVADNTYLEFISNTALEGTTAPMALHTVEVQYDNYTQIVRTPFRLTNDEIEMLVHGEQELPYNTRKAGIEHARKLERILKFGGKPGAESGTTPAQAGGLEWFIRSYSGAVRVKADTTLTADGLWAWIRHCFRYGSANKILFAPPVMIEFINRLTLSHLQLSPVDKSYGLNMQTLIWGNCKLGVIQDKGLEGPVEGGGTYNYAFILDLDDLAWCYVRGRDTALLTGRQANDADEYLAEYLTEGCLEIKNFKAHGMWYAFTGYTL